MTKVCTKCGIEKDEEKFRRDSSRVDGLYPWCTECRTKYDFDRNHDPEVRVGRRNRKHLPIPGLRITCRQCQVEKDEKEFDLSPSNFTGRSYTCKECRAEADEVRRRSKGIRPKPLKQSREEALKKRRENQRIYRADHRAEVNRRARTQNKARRKKDPGFAIKTQLGNRLGDAVRNGQKAGSGVRDLGCSIEELKKHLEAKFQPGMTWENRGHGFGKWNIDHIIPLAAFDLTSRQHVVLACYYLNLQPLWHEDNMSKGDKLDIF